MTHTFQIGNKGYRCDKETLKAVRAAVKMEEATSDNLMVHIRWRLDLNQVE